MSTEIAIVVIGLGNPLRHDDGVGLLVARQLGACAPPGVDVLIHRGGGLSLMDIWEGVPVAVVVDAVSSGAPAGTVHRFDASTQALPEHLRATCSTHDFGLNEAIELARALDRLPNRFIVIGVEGADFAPGSCLSPAVEDAVENAVEAVMKEICSLATSGGSLREAEHA